MYLLRSSPSRWFQIFVWFIVDLVIWGFVTKYLSGIGTQFNFLAVLLGAVVLWGFVARVQQGVMMAFLEDVWSRNFANLFATPLTVAEYLTGMIVSGALTSLSVLVCITFLAYLLFGFSLLSLGITLIPFLVVLFLFGIVLGIVAAAVVLRFGPSSEWFVWAFSAIANPFVGVFYPIEVLPDWMQMIARLLPPSYVFEGMREVIHAETFSTEALIVSSGLSLVYIAGAYALFASVHRFVTRTGLIARFSAESI